MGVRFDAHPPFDIDVPVVVVGGGACGLTAALAARDRSTGVLVLEQDAAPSGSTALSSGFIPACATRWQRAAGIVDDVQRMADDILDKARRQTDADYVTRVCRASGPALEWLCDRHALELVLLTGFTYPGHSVARMHAHPERTGKALVGALTRAVERCGVDILTHATVTDLYASQDGRVHGIRAVRPDGNEEHVGCGALVLACSGFGANPEMVRKHIPEMADALYFGHPGNRGDALAWGHALGARLEDMGAYQGHGSVATPHGILVTWALMMEGGIQVNRDGERFSNEHEGYSEQAVAVLAQPGGIAWDVYDERLHRLGLEFDDYRQAVGAGAVRSAASPAELAQLIGVPSTRLGSTLERCATYQRGDDIDAFGRDFTKQPALSPPLYAARVTGALFHTQGGLVVDERAAVCRSGGGVFPNLFAGGGAARGVSGPAVWGYLSGNGLLSAVTLGRIAGEEAARVAMAGP